jgi:hypothetical protein
MNQTNTIILFLKQGLVIAGIVASFFIFSASVAFAATLSISPNTGVYNSNGTFTVRVNVNSGGQSINAAEGTLSFNPRELSVVSVTRASSIFNLWIAEPTFSNSAGTINFSGGSPAGFTGSSGNIMSITFRAIGSGAPRVSFSNGSVLANDGRGSNVLTSMGGGTYTIQAATTAPAQEVIVEYVAPANTPGAPTITSGTHSDPSTWHTNKTATLNWTVPAGVTGVRTLLNSSPSSVPTRVYETPISTITLSDLDEGVSYFHLQFRNEDGWGRVSSYRLAVDSTQPSKIDITQPEDADFTNPDQKLQVVVEDDGSQVKRFMVRVDNNEAFEIVRENDTDTLSIPALSPGYHTIIIEAFDEANNSIVGTYSLTILSFEKPTFTEYPTEINEEVIPVFKGMTRPDAKVIVTVTKLGSEPNTFEVQSNELGEFTYIPEGRFSSGVYEFTATAVDQFGAQSDVSDTIRVAVQQPGFIRVGSFIVSVLSVIIPLVALAAVLIVGSWYLLAYLRRFRSKVRVESIEALDILRREFTNLQQELVHQESLLTSARKTKKLTKAETEMIQVINAALQASQAKVEKEIIDVTNLTKN